MTYIVENVEGADGSGKLAPPSRAVTVRILVYFPLACFLTELMSLLDFELGIPWLR